MLTGLLVGHSLMARFGVGLWCRVGLWLCLAGSASVYVHVGLHCMYVVGAGAGGQVQRQGSVGVVFTHH